MANNNSVKKMCQLASNLNSDRDDRNQTTDLNNSPTRYHSTTALTAFFCLQFSMYLAAERCARWAWRARGERGDIKRENCSVKSFFRKKAKDKREKVRRPKVADWQYLGVDKFTR